MMHVNQRRFLVPLKSASESKFLKRHRRIHHSQFGAEDAYLLAIRMMPVNKILQKQSFWNGFHVTWSCAIHVSWWSIVLRSLFKTFPSWPLGSRYRIFIMFKLNSSFNHLYNVCFLCVYLYVYIYIDIYIYLYQNPALGGGRPKSCQQEFQKNHWFGCCLHGWATSHQWPSSPGTHSGSSDAGVLARNSLGQGAKFVFLSQFTITQ